jgi:hypothetical protein
VVHNYLNFTVILNRIRWIAITVPAISLCHWWALRWPRMCHVTLQVVLGVCCCAHYSYNFKLTRISVRKKFYNVTFVPERHTEGGEKERNKNSSFKKYSVLIILYGVCKCVVLRNLCFCKWSTGNYQYTIFWVSQGTKYFKWVFLW